MQAERIAQVGVARMVALFSISYKNRKGKVSTSHSSLLPLKLSDMEGLKPMARIILYLRRLALFIGPGFMIAVG
jgi:hypothetical protein